MELGRLAFCNKVNNNICRSSVTRSTVCNSYEIQQYKLCFFVFECVITYNF